MEYEDQFVLQPPSAATTASTTKTTGIILIHPIGVGIGRWFYTRFVSALVEQFRALSDTIASNQQRRLVVLVPDLIGSGSASKPLLLQQQQKQDSSTSPSRRSLPYPPLLNIIDWTEQLIHLMTETAKTNHDIDEWCLVANGGCSPIALQVAAQQCGVKDRGSPVTLVQHIVLSSVPRCPSFCPIQLIQKWSKIPIDNYAV